jgi:hypothetical protein
MIGFVNVPSTRTAGIQLPAEGNRKPTPLADGLARMGVVPLDDQQVTTDQRRMVDERRATLGFYGRHWRVSRALRNGLGYLCIAALVIGYLADFAGSPVVGTVSFVISGASFIGAAYLWFSLLPVLTYDWRVRTFNRFKDDRYVPGHVIALRWRIADQVPYARFEVEYFADDPYLVVSLDSERYRVIRWD